MTILTQRFCNYGFPAYFPFCFKRYQKSYMVFKHRELLACVVVYKKTWF